MDAIVLAGGYAKRLWPLTEVFPKALLAIAGRPVLYHVIENVLKIPDVQKAIVAVDDNHTKVFQDSLESLQQSEGAHVLMSAHKGHKGHKGRPKYDIKSPMEKLGELLTDAHKFGLSSSRLLVVGADNLFGLPLSEFVDFQRQEDVSCIAIQRRPAREDASDFGVPTLDKTGRVVEFEEKPVKRSPYTLISTACYIFRREDAEMVHDYLNDIPEETLGAFIRWLKGKTPLKGFQFSAEWFDIGTRDGILSANKYLLSKDDRYRSYPNLVSGKTRIIGPIFIEDDATVQDSTIGPNVYIGSGAKIIRSVVEESIVYETSKVVDCDLFNSVVGAGSVVEGRVSEAVFGPRSMIATEK